MNFVVYDVATGEILKWGAIRPGQDLSEFGTPVLEVEDYVMSGSHYIAAGKPVAIPPRPSSIDTWDWNTKQWVDARTPEDVKESQRRQIRKEIDWLEAQQAGPLRSVTRFLAVGDKPPPETVAALVTIDDRIGVLLADLQKLG